MGYAASLRAILFTVAVVLAMGVMADACAVDVDPGDYVPAPAGTTAALLYLQHAERDASYTGGTRNAGNPLLTSDVAIIRLVHYMTIGGYTVSPQILLPFASLRGGRDIKALGNENAMGDIILAAPVWLINDTVKSTFLALTPYVYLPTGAYSDRRALNVGENRWKFDLQAGLAQQISGPWYLDLTGDVMVFGENTDYGSNRASLRQKPLWQLQSYLRYQFSPTSNAYTGLSRTWGGESRLNGVPNNDQTNQSKISLGASTFIGAKTQVMVSIGRDLSVDNGFKENFRFNLRLLQIF
ncbi:transporter [Herbaspirillum sp. alder98]|uniref:transporter n=1 Tax=Herbaspirillum sp. alder98 TaxID=2913096 RepID=UPI001CD8593F|nr:transporter [Herbaspirillum sp. alder98]MCA1325103.1 transporter [Herbaspirillum sp. alder98]